MAAWHYRCSLVPKNSIVQYHRNLGWEAPLNDDYIGCTVDYFEIEISKQFTDKIKLCFAQYYPFVEIWDGGVSFENSTDSKIEIFPDDIECKLNLLNIDLQFIDILIDVAQRCLFPLLKQKRFLLQLGKVCYMKWHIRQNIYSYPNGKKRVACKQK